MFSLGEVCQEGSWLGGAPASFLILGSNGIEKPVFVLPERSFPGQGLPLERTRRSVAHDMAAKAGGWPAGVLNRGDWLPSRSAQGGIASVSVNRALPQSDGIFSIIAAVDAKLFLNDHALATRGDLITQMQHLNMLSRRLKDSFCPLSEARCLVISNYGSAIPAQEPPRLPFI